MDKGGPALLSSCPSVCRDGVCPVSLCGGRRGKPRLYGKTTLFLNNNQFFICGHQHFAARRRNHHHIFDPHTPLPRQENLHAKPPGLALCPTRQVETTEPGRKAKIVLDSRTSARLPARRF